MMTPEPASAPPPLVDAPALPARCYRVETSPERFVLHVRAFEDRNVARALRLAGRLVLVGTVPLSWLEDQRVGAAAIFAVIFVWLYGGIFTSRVTPFDGPFVRVARRGATIALPLEPAYRDGAPRGATLAIDGEPIPAGRVVRAAVARLFDPAGSTPGLCSVNLVLRDGVVRVAKLQGEATSRRLAEAIAAALGIGYDPEELPRVCVLPGWPYGWKAQVLMGVVIFAAVAVLLVGLFLVRTSPIGWSACAAAALALDVGVNDLILGRAMRRLAADEARASFGVGKDA